MSDKNFLQRLFSSAPETTANLYTEEELRETLQQSQAFQELYPTGLYGRMETILDELDMSKVIRALSNAEGGVYGEMLDLYERMETSDLRLRSLIRNRRLSASRTPYNIQMPTGEEKNPEVLKAKELLERNIDRLNWSNTIQDLLDGRLYGVAVFEKVWDKSADGTLFVKNLKEIDHYRIEADMDVRPMTDMIGKENNFGELRLLTSIREREYIKDIPEYKLITAVNTTRKGKYDLHGELRPVARWFVIKTFTAKMWAQYADKFGFPFVSVKIDKQNFDKYKTEIKKLLESAGANRWAVFFDFMEYETQSASSTADISVFDRLIQTCNTEMAIGVLGQSLTTDVGNSGSRALGDVHQSVKDDISEDDNMWLDEIINQQFCRDIFKFNFPNLPPELYPKYQTKSPKDIDLREFAEGVKAMSKLIPVSVEWIYKESEVPKPDADEETIGGYVKFDPLLNQLNPDEDEPDINEDEN